mmetsp:Transcript_69777/g.134621  ORF Transcript_69777/g.134621 Transcript_69777/m.134621 type:complete len:332 (+) Transcript_69777:81-1076(+)
MTQAKVSLSFGQKSVGLPQHEVGVEAVTTGQEEVSHCRSGGAEESVRLAVRGGSASTVALDEAEGDSDVTHEPDLSETNPCLRTVVHSGLEPISPVPVVKEARSPGLTPSSECTIGLQSPAVLEGPAAGTLQRRRLLMAFSHPAVCIDGAEDSQPKVRTLSSSTGAGVEEVQRWGLASSPPHDLRQQAAQPTIAIDQMHQAPRARLRAELPRTPQACGEATHPLTASARHGAVFQMGQADNVQRMRLCAELPGGQPVHTNAGAATAATVAAVARNSRWARLATLTGQIEWSSAGVLTARRPGMESLAMICSFLRWIVNLSATDNAAQFRII